MVQTGFISKIIADAALILSTSVTGFILHKTGRPYNTGIFTFHKLLTLGFIIHLSSILFKFAKDQGISIFLISLLVLAVVAILALLATGAMLSIDKQHDVMLQIHKISAIGFLVGIAVVFYLILGN